MTIVEYIYNIYSTIRIEEFDMSDETKSKADLIAELTALRHDYAVLQSAEHKTEIALCHIEEQLHTLITVTSDIVCFKDEHGRWLAANQAIIKLFTLGDIDYIGKKDSELAVLVPFFSEALAVCQSTDLKAWQTAKAITIEEIFPHPDGTTITFEVIKSPIFYPDGKRKGLILIGRDITERNKTQQALLESIQQFKTLAENAPYIISRVNQKLQYSYINPLITMLTGIPHENFIGKTATQAGLRKAWTESMDHAVLRTFSTGKACSFESTFSKHNGEQLFYLCHAIPEFSQDGTVQSVLRISSDITTQRNLEKKLARLDRLHMVGEMAAGMGHEVRNPLTTVRGFLQMLKNKNQYSHHTRYFTIMIEELDRANSIITEFLSLAKNKAINKQAQDLNAVLLILVPLLKADALVTNKYINLELFENLPKLLLDETEIRQLILNLVHNGLEAMTTTGTLTIRTFIDGNAVILAIEDEGTGMTPDILEKIGTPFFTTKDHGTGLGLAICYNIAHRHNATIEPQVHATGTTFFVRFPQISNEDL